MTHAETHSQIPAEQYGSRKMHQAIDAALNKVLTQDMKELKPCMVVPFFFWFEFIVVVFYFSHVGMVIGKLVPSVWLIDINPI
jgi:hypothetical protein